MTARFRALQAAALLFWFCLGACVARERVVYQQRTEFQEVVVAESTGGVRTLRFGERGAVQSRVRLGHPEELLVPYMRTAMVGLGLVSSPDRILVVGLGGGSIPAFLHHHFPDTEIDAVELDPVVVEVAERWFEVVEDDRLRILVSDGRRFVERATEPYDVIFLDAFGETSIPTALTTKQFLESVRAALTPQGVVIANLWSGSANPLYPSMLETYRVVFDDLYVVPVPKRTNRILLATPGVAARSRSTLNERLRELSERFGDGLDLERTFEGKQSVTKATGGGAASILLDA